MSSKITKCFSTRIIAVLIMMLFFSGCTMDVDGRVEELKIQSTKNIADGNLFLEKNKKKEDVKETASGLQYQVIEEGAGASPKASDKVRVHYRGTLMNGTEFDSSYSRGKPAEFPVNRLIPGWTEALQMMKPGSKWVIYVPEHLAYGKKSPSRDIPPSSLLIFEMELLNVL